MATIQANLLAPSRLSSLTSLTTVNSVSSRTTVECKAWTTRQRRSLTIRATSAQGNPQSPSAPGRSGIEAPLGGGATTAPLPQKDVPKAERMAYVCQACGYIYDLDQPWEEQPDTYACPVCTAPKESFTAANATLGEGVFDPTKGEDVKI